MNMKQRTLWLVALLFLGIASPAFAAAPQFDLGTALQQYQSYTFNVTATATYTIRHNDFAGGQVVTGHAWDYRLFAADAWQAHS